MDTLLEQMKLAAGDGATNDFFGWSVSIDGDTAIVGALLDDDNGDNSGSAYILSRSGGTWTQQQKLTPSDGAAFDQFGQSVYMSGDTAVAGAPFDDDNGSSSGSAYVFTRSGGTWVQQQKLTPADGEAGDRFGFSVSIDNDTVVIGAVTDDDNGSDSGSAYVFTRSGGVWTQQQKLTPMLGTGFFPQAFDQFGVSVSVSGDLVLIGANGKDMFWGNQGAAYFFHRSGGVWGQKNLVFDGSGSANDQFGSSVSIDGDVALIGVPLDDDKGSASGSVFLYIGSLSGNFSPLLKLTASDGATGDQFGFSVSVNGDTAVVGSFLDNDVPNDSGSAYIFRSTGGKFNWSAQQKQKLTASDDAAGDRFARSVSLSGSTVLIGAYLHDRVKISIQESHVHQGDVSGVAHNKAVGHLSTVGSLNVLNPRAARTIIVAKVHCLLNVQARGDLIDGGTVGSADEVAGWAKSGN